MFSYDEYVEVKFNLISSVFDVHVFLSFHMDWDNTKRERESVEIKEFMYTPHSVAVEHIRVWFQLGSS